MLLYKPAGFSEKLILRNGYRPSWNYNSVFFKAFAISFLWNVMINTKMWLHQTQWLGMDENRSNDKEICELIPSDIYFPICMTFTNNEIRTPIIFLWRLFFITVLAKTDWVCHHQAQKQPPPHPNQNLRLSYKQQKQKPRTMKGMNM